MTLGGKTFVAGLAVAAGGSVSLVASVPWPPSAADVIARAPLAGVVVVGALVAVIGVFIYVFQPAVDRDLAARLPVATVRTALAMTLVIFVLANLASIPYLLFRGQQPVALPRGQQQVLGPLGLFYVTAASELPILFVVWARILHPGGVPWQSFRLGGERLMNKIGQGVAGGIGLIVAAAVVEGLLARAGVRQNQFQEFQGVQGAPAGLFALALIAGCVLAPFAEEIFFRGYVFQSFLQRRGPVWAYLFSAALFALVHGNPAAAAPIFVLGLLLAYLFQRTGSLLPGMIAHGLNNLLAFLLLYRGLTG